MTKRVLQLKKVNDLLIEQSLVRFLTQKLLQLGFGLKKAPLQSVVFNSFTKLEIQFVQELNILADKPRNLVQKMLWNSLMVILSKISQVISPKTILFNIWS